MADRKQVGRQVQAEARLFSDRLLDREEQAYAAISGVFEAPAERLSARLGGSAAPLTDGFLAVYFIALQETLEACTPHVADLLQDGARMALESVGREMELAARALAAKHRWRPAAALAAVDEASYVLNAVAVWAATIPAIRARSQATLRATLNTDASRVFVRPDGAWWRAAGDTHARVRELVIELTNGLRTQAMEAFNL